MEAVTSVTAAKMRALREAKKLGCSGAHQTDDGKWRPCASAEKLRSLRPIGHPNRASMSVSPKTTRSQMGSNNIQRQWEPLGSRGVVAIDTITGGGLVSGVVGKAYQPAAPRDEDPDVFTDIEAARDRSRQLGCIGVSRRISRSGRTIWMPCTNMSDLSNRTGRTALGRRNMQKRSERFIMDAIRKAKPKAERRRAKSIYDDLHGQLTQNAFDGIEVKRLGPKVGQGIGRGLRSAPNGFVFVDVTGAIDADKDGIVFEGKPLERPIIPKFIVPEGAGRRISKLFEGTALTNEENRRKYGTAGVGEIDPETFSRIAGLVPESIAPQRNANERDNETIQSMRSIFGGLRKRKPTTQKRKEQIGEDQTEGLPTEAATGEDISSTSRKKARKEVSGVLRNIDEVTDEYEFYGYTDLKELVAQMVPTSLEELEETLRSNPFTRNYARRLIKRIAAAEPDFEAAQVVRTMLQNEVGNTPGVAAALRQFGMPPIVVTKYQPDVEGMGLLGISGGGPEEWNFVMGGYASSGFIAFNTEAIPNPGNFDEVARARGFEFRNIDVDQMLRHELAHAWEVMAAKQNPRSLEHYVETLAEMHENLKRGTRNVTDFEGGAFEPEYRRIGWGTKQERASARKISEYAETARVEWFAESFAAYTDDSYAVRATVDNVSIQNMADVFGISVNEFVTRFSNDGGRRGRGNLSAERLATLGDRLLGMRSARMKEAIDWYDEHPDYLEDAPLDVLVRMSPDKVDAAFGTTIQSMRSASDSAARARVSNDPDTRLGQQILDAIFGRAKRKNMDPDRPTLWFLGGTTGSGKSRMRQSGVFVGVPTPDEIPDIDPDEIKKGHPRWNGGKGALEIHRWSTQWTRYGRRQAIEQQRDHVITGTGVRTDQLSDAKRAGYTTIGHFVYTPVDVAEKRMRARAKDGGTNLPLYKAQGYSDDLRRTTTDAILRGDMDEFYLYDNSIDGANPSLAVQRTRDGRYQILNQRVFEAFLGKENARRVERYWSTIARDDDDPNGPSTMRSMRSAKSPPRTEMFRKQFIRPKDLAGRNMRHSYLGRAQIDTNIDLSEYDWSHSQWVGIDLKPAQKILKPFNGRFMLVSESTWDGVRFPEGTTFAGAKFERVVFNGGDLRGVDMSGAELWGVEFSPSTNLDGVRFDNAIFARATFRGSDLRNSGITVEQIQSSGIEWDDATKFPPEVQQYVDSLRGGVQREAGYIESLRQGIQKVRDPETGLTSLVNRREGTTPNIKMAIDDVRAKRRSQPPIRPNLDEVRTATEVVKGVELSRTSLLEEDAETLTGKSLASGFARFTSFVGRKLRDAKFIQMDMENADLTDAELVKTSFTSSILRRARFIGAKIRETVSFRGSDLTDADFTDVDFGKNGKIDLRGARLMGTTLGKMAPKNILWDDETDWRGAKWEIDVLPRDLQKSGITQIRMRSMRGGTVNDARTAISTYNDTIINWKSLSKNERQDFVDEFTLSYRDILDSRLNAFETNEVLKGELETGNSLDEQIERLTSLLTNDISPLMDDIKNNNYRKFAESFRSAKQSNPEFMRGRSARTVFNDAQALMIRRDASRTRANGLRTYRNNEIEKSKLLDSMRSLLLDDLYTVDALKKPTGSLPGGTRSTEPLIPNAESLRSRRRINLLDAQYDELDTIAKETEAKPFSPETVGPVEALRLTLVAARMALKNELGKSISAAPGIGDEDGARMRDSIRVEIAPNRIPMLIAQPFKAIVDELPDKRDWSAVLAPSLDDARRLANAILEARKSRSPLPMKLSEKERSKILEQIYGLEPFQRIIDKIVSSLGSSSDEWTGNADSFVQLYLQGIRHPQRMQGLPGSDGVHDFFGHAGIGRGFDRHGEFAAALTTDSLLRDHQEFGFFTPDEREFARREFFDNGVAGFLRIRENARLEFSQKHGIDLYADERDMSPEQLADKQEIEDIFNIIFEELNADVLDRASWRPYLTFDEILDSLGVPPSTTRASLSTESPSMRSARRSIPLTDASDELLLSIAQQEADIKLDRSMRSVRRRRPITEDERARFQPLNLAPDQKMKIQPGTKIVFVSGGDQVFHSVIVGPQVWRLRGVEGVDAYIDPEPPDQEFIDELVREWNDKFGPVDSPSRQAVSRGGRGPSRGEPIGTTDTNEDPVERNIRQAQEVREQRSMRSSRPMSTDDAAVLSSLGVVVPISVERDVRPVLPTSSAPPMPRTRRGQDRPQLSTLVPQIRTKIGADGRLQIDSRDKKRLVLNHSSIIDNLKMSDIPDDYKLSKRIEQQILDDIKEVELRNGAPLTEDRRQQMIKNMRLKTFKQDIRIAILRDSLFPNDDGTLSAAALGGGDARKLFTQSSIANLAEGESIFITDIPGTSTSSFTKNAIVSRIDGMLVMTELTDKMAERLRKHVSRKTGRDSFSGASINTFDELFDVSHFPGGVAYNQLDETRDAITRLGESIGDLRSDIPKPHVVLKQDYAFYPPGSGQVVKDIAGIANLDDGAISFFGTSRHHLGLLPITHEWGHFVQHELRRRGKFDSGDDGDWAMAMFLDKTSIGLADIPKGEYITAPIPGGPVMTSLKGIHVPKINSASVTEYGTTDVGEDWAESVALFLIDKRVGWLLHEPDASGNSKEGGRKITFAELYPQRAQLLERHLYGKEATAPRALIGQPDNNGGTSVRSMRSRLTPDYDKRFKDKYGSRVPSGDGDCFSAAHDMLSTLRKQPYNFTSDQIRLVHGTPLGTGGEAEGIRFPHAWVEVNTRGWSAYEDLRKQTEDLRNTIQRTIDEQEQRRLGQQLMRLESQLMMQDITIYDYSNGNEFEGPRVLYYAIGNIREEDSRYYSTDDATKRMMENEHYGPWE